MRTTTSGGGTVRVWDVVVRLFHWSTVALVSLAFLTGDARSAHTTFGYALMAILGVRIVWGFVGSPHARFADFVPGPRRLAAYLGAMARRAEGRSLGHNPAGGAMVVLLMATIAGIGLTGWLMGVRGWRGLNWLEELHEGLANGLLLMVAAHVAGVIHASLRHGENLVAAMVTGLKKRQ